MRKPNHLIDEEEFDYKTITHAVEMLDFIDEFHMKAPANRRSKERKEWEKKLIEMHKYYNEIVGFKCLKTII